MAVEIGLEQTVSGQQRYHSIKITRGREVE